MNREELLRSARNLYENPGTNEALKVVLEETYPELKASEDERIRKALVKTFEKKLEIGFEWTEFGIPNRSVLDWLEKHKEQKPAEWSEEDENFLSSIVECCKYGVRISDAAISRLKSLRPHPSWKPSEYMLSLVKKVADGEMLTNMEQMAMGTLYNDLQKL